MFTWFKFESAKPGRTAYSLHRLSCEELEVRCVPTRFLWCPLDPANPDYHTPRNWAKEVFDPDQAWERLPAMGAEPPNSSADIQLAGSAKIDGVDGVNTNVNMILSMAGGWDVHSVTIWPSYTATVALQSDLVVSGEVFSPLPERETNSYVKMGSATIAGAGGKLVIDPGATFLWEGGTLRDLSVEVKAKNATHPNAQVIVRDVAAGSGQLMLSSGLDVKGTLWWQSGNVNCDLSAPIGMPASAIHVRDTGMFLVDSGGTWGTDSNNLVVTNSGSVSVDTSGTATLNGSYTTLGRTVLLTGTLLINGAAVQQAPEAIFNLAGGTYRAGGLGSALSVWDGYLIGTGTIEGNLHLGNPALGGVPTLAPGDTINPNPTPQAPGATRRGIGSIDVTGNLGMVGGWMVIDVAGPSPSQHDQVRVVGQADLAGKVAGSLWRPHAPIPADSQIVFLKYAQRVGDFIGHAIPDGWTKDKDGVKYWLQPPNTAVRGRAAFDGNGNGAFEPWLGETVLAGVPVELLDEYGEPVVEPTTTDAAGEYDFGAVEYGNYTVRFTRPEELRPVSPGDGSNESADSDYGFDYSLDTALTPVSLGEMYPYVWNTADALFRPLVAVADAHTTAYRTAVGGNVLDNDPPADDDTLTVTVHPDHEPAGGALVLNTDGTFTYTPDAGFWGTDSFVYVVEDSFGHTATATVTITVIPPPATVSGRVWWDDDADGIQDVTETNSSYGWVALFDENDVMVAQMPVDNDGTFAFTVAAGTYRLYVSQASFNPSPQDQGGDDELDSDVDANGSSGWFTLAPDEAIDLDVGMVYFV